MEKDDKNTLDKKIIIKVTAIVIGIIAAIVACAVLFSLTLLPIYKYKNAQRCAERGEYEAAVANLISNNYKDSADLCSVYALKAGQNNYEIFDMDKAVDYCNISFMKKSNIDAYVYLYILGAADYNDSVCGYVIDTADTYYENGDLKKAEVYYKYALNSANEEYRTRAEQNLENIE